MVLCGAIQTLENPLQAQPQYVVSKTLAFLFEHGTNVAGRNAVPFCQPAKRGVAVTCTQTQVSLDCAQLGLLEAAMPGGDFNVAWCTNRERSKI